MDTYLYCSCGPHFMGKVREYNTYLGGHTSWRAKDNAVSENDTPSPLGTANDLRGEGGVSTKNTFNAAHHKKSSRAKRQHHHEPRYTKIIHGLFGTHRRSRRRSCRHRSRSSRRGPGRGRPRESWRRSTVFFFAVKGGRTEQGITLLPANIGIQSGKIENAK